MAQTGYTPISLYYSTTASAVPVNTNLSNGELAINITDGKLYYKDNGGTVRLLASNATSAPVLTFSAGTTGLTPNTATTGAVTLGGTLATTNGGTGLTSFTANGVVYASSSSALATGSALTFDGTNLGTTGTITAGGSNIVLTGRGSATYPTSGAGYFQLRTNNVDGTTGGLDIYTDSGGTLRQSYRIFEDSVSGGCYQTWNVAGAEQMRLTTTGLGIGTSSPAYKLDVQGATGSTISGIYDTAASGSSIAISRLRTTGTGRGYWDIRTGNTASGLTGALDFFDNIAGASRLNLDSSGNLGLGITPSAWSASYRTIQGGITSSNYGSIWFSSNGDGGANCFGQVGIGNNTLGGSTYAGTGASSFYLQSGGRHSWYNYPAGVAGNSLPGYTQAMTLDASGNLGIGTTSPATRLAVASAVSTSGNILTLTNTSAYANNNALQIDFNANNANGGMQTFAAINAYNQYAIGNNYGNIAFKVANAGSIATAMLLDYQGNLGLGVTPSAWNASSRAFQWGSSGTATLENYNGLNAVISFNAYRNTSNQFVYTTTNRAVQFGMGYDGQFTWNQAASGTAGNAITFTQAMTLDASGNLGIGTTSPANKFQVYQSTAGTGAGKIEHVNGNYINVQPSYNYYGAYNHIFQSLSGSSEYARIDNNGSVLIGFNTSPASTYKFYSIDSVNVYTGNDASGTTTLRLGSSGSMPQGIANIAGIKTAAGSGVMTFATGSGGSTSEVARFDQNGYFGIGTTSPSSKLTIFNVPSTPVGMASGTTLNNTFGGILHLEYTTLANLVYASGTTPTPVQTIKCESQPSGTIGVGTRYFARSSSGGSSSWFTGAVSDGSFVWQDTNVPAERARIDSSGNFKLNGGYMSFNNNGYIRADISNSLALQSGSSTTIGFQVKTADNATTKLSMSGTGGTSLALEGATPQTGVGISFPATQAASSDANTLDDYEEGTWTPVLSAAGSAPTVTYNYVSGVYRKVGSMVYVQMGMNVNSISGGSGETRITGLPFAGISRGSYQEPTTSVQGGNWVTAAYAGQTYGFVVDGSTYFHFRYQNNSDTSISISQWQGGTPGTYINFTLVYCATA
jgi:hypothetical protein